MTHRTTQHLLPQPVLIDNLSSHVRSYLGGHSVVPLVERPTGQLGASEDLPQNGYPSFASGSVTGTTARCNRALECWVVIP